jgi:hypothetical protein
VRFPQVALQQPAEVDAVLREEGAVEAALAADPVAELLRRLLADEFLRAKTEDVRRVNELAQKLKVPMIWVPARPK